MPPRAARPSICETRAWAWIWTAGRRPERGQAPLEAQCHATNASRWIRMGLRLASLPRRRPQWRTRMRIVVLDAHPLTRERMTAIFGQGPSVRV
jgi:hypothetical protein